MRFDLTCSPFACVLCILLARLLYRFGQSGKSAPAGSKLPKRTRALQPFAGLTSKPEGEGGAQHARSQPPAPGAPPPRMIVPRGRRRHVDTTGPFCPPATCAYHGRVDWGNLRANGHPHGRRWRQLGWFSCQRHFLETSGTPLHGTHVDPDKLGWAMAALAAGLGIRAVARVFETDPNTVLGWLVEGAEHLEAFSH